MLQPQTCYLHFEVHHHDQQMCMFQQQGLGFKTCLKRRIITLKLYSEANRIELSHPTKISTIHNDLNQEFNIMANMFWTWFKFKKFKNQKKSFRTFTTFCHIFFWKRKIFESINWSKVFVSFETYTILAISVYNLIVKEMTIVKVLDNNNDYEIGS